MHMHVQTSVTCSFIYVALLGHPRALLLLDDDRVLPLDDRVGRHGRGTTPSSFKKAPGGMGGATCSSLTKAPGGMGGTVPSSLSIAP